MDDKRIETIVAGFTHEPIGMAMMEALRWVRDESAKEERERVVKLGKSIGGIKTPRMEGDNLAIVLCGHFDNPEQEDDGETGWTPDATAGCDEVLAAIRKHYES